MACATRRGPTPVWLMVSCDGDLPTGSRGSGVGQLQSDVQCRSKETNSNAGAQERPLSFAMAPVKWSRERTIIHRMTAGTNVVHSSSHLDTCGDGVSGRRFMRRSRFLASGCTPVDSGMQR